MAVAAPTLDCEVVDLTPKMAAELLARNTSNRKLLAPYVAKLAEAMTRGEWVVNGEPIQIAEDGTLLNGQHRLAAVVQSEATVPMLLVRGLPVSAQKTMDSGSRRNLSDVLKLHGEQNTASLGATLGLLHRHRVGARMDSSSRTAPTSQEALAVLALEPTIRDGLPLAHKVHRLTKMRVSVSGVLIYLFNEEEAGEGTRFFEALCVSEDARERTAMFALRSILDRIKSDRSYKLSTYVLCAMTIKTFNAWSEGAEMGVLAFKPGGDKPEAFPEIRALARDPALDGAVA
jgi:hypothetical protein